jgi:hypothetical protein
MLAAIEICLTAIALALAYVAPKLGAAWFERIEKAFLRLARRRSLAVLVVGMAALATRLAVLPVLPIPQPGIHDEFSHLLLADTLAHGQVANVTHPMWTHFETFHVNQRPTYASMYYPGQGFALAVGQVIFGHPFWGVWLSVGAMCAAICWALQGWMPASWALLGGFLAVMRLATFSYWANTYYGGAVAAIGGALVLGALPRIKRRQHVSDALLMGLGLALLANTRPYEGLFFCTPIAVALLIWMVGRDAPQIQFSLRYVVVPLALVTCLTLAGMGYYFWRVSGSPLRIPYQVNMSAYHLVYFPWQKLATDAEYHHSVMRAFYQGPPVAGQYHHARLHPLLWLALKPLPHLIFFLGPALMLPVVAWLAIKCRSSSARSVSRKTLFLLIICSVTAIGLALPIYIPPAHYAAPLTAAIYALVLQAMRYVRSWRYNGQRSGLFLVRAVPVICLALLPVRTAASLLHIPVPVTVIHTWYTEDVHNVDRARVLRELQFQPGRHLIIVRYTPDHEILDEWVYNRADIDGSKVVWARDMGMAKNEELLQYFKDRHAWLLEPDENPLKLVAYACALSPCASMVASGEGERLKAAN